MEWFHAVKHAWFPSSGKVDKNIYVPRTVKRKSRRLLGICIPAHIHNAGVSPAINSNVDFIRRLFKPHGVNVAHNGNIALCANPAGKDFSHARCRACNHKSFR